MRKLHFIGGEKGGIGKSFTSRLLAQYYIDQQRPFVGFDTDQSHSTFSRFYGEFTSTLKTEGESLDQIIETLDAHPHCDVIVDLAAQTANNVFRWVEQCDLFELLADMGVQAYFWHLVDDSADCKNLLHAMLDKLDSKNARLIVVKNSGRGINFTPLESSSTYANALDAGASIVELEALPAALVQKIDFDNISFWAAANNSGQLGRVERQRVKAWLKRQYDQLESVLPLVEPAQEEQQFTAPESFFV